MNPAQLVRALGQVSKRTGLADRQGELVALEERVTCNDRVDLLDEMAQAVDRSRPVRTKGAVAPALAVATRLGNDGLERVDLVTRQQVARMPFVALLAASFLPDLLPLRLRFQRILRWRLV